VCACKQRLNKQITVTGFRSIKYSRICDICNRAGQTFTIRFSDTTTDQPLVIEFSELPDILLSHSSTPVSQSAHKLATAQTTSVTAFVQDVAAAISTTRDPILTKSGSIHMADFGVEWFTFEQMTALFACTIVIDIEITSQSVFVTFSNPLAQSQTSLRVIKQRKPHLFQAKKINASTAKKSSRRKHAPPKLQ